MNLKDLKELCRAQDIDFNLMSAIKCPKCGETTLIIELDKDKARCLSCKKKYKNMDELRDLVIEEFRYKHRETVRLMENNKGVI